MSSGGETFSKRLAINCSARRKEVGRLLGVARREAQLSQKVVADVLNYDQSDISRIEGGTRLIDVVLENFAVLYQKPPNFFSTWKAHLTQTSGQGWRPVLTEDELRVRALEAKVRRGRRKAEGEGD